MMKTNGIRVLAMLLSVIMVMGVLAVLPFSASAYHMDDKLDDGSRPKGVQVPDGITVYDGVQTATPENGAVALERDDDGAFLIQSAAEFMYFRNVLAVQETLLIGATDAVAEDLTSLPAAEATFKLTCDIALNTYDYGAWHSHNGFGAVPTGTFAGTFDGGNHTIYNLYEFNAKEVALFQTVTGTVKNLNFAGARIMNNSVGTYDGTYSALVAINLDGTVDNVHGTSCSFKGTYAAGIATIMLNGAIIKNCSMDGTVTGSFVAGIAASHRDTNETTEGTYITIKDCVNRADVTNTASQDAPNPIAVAAGILGSEQNYNNQSTGFRIVDCVNEGTITAQKYAAGIVGVSHKATQEATITDCVNRGNVVTSVAGGVSGGIAGDVPGSGGDAEHTTPYFTRCYNYGNVTAVGTAGGVVGRTNPDDKGYSEKGAFFRDCGNYGKVTSDGVAGGILGQTSGLSYVGNVNLYFSNCISAGDVEGGTIAGGLIGQADIRGTTIAVAGCMIACNVTGVTQAAALLGNAANQESNGTVALTNTWVTGTVTVAEGGTAALIAISAKTTPTKLTATDSGFAVTVKVGETTLTAEEMAGAYYKNSESAFIPVESYKDGSTTVNARYPVTDIKSFTDGTAKTSLNTYATKNGYTTWVQGNKVPTTLRTLGFTGATMSLSSNMALNMKLDASTLAGLTVTNVAFVDAEGNGINAVKDDLDRYSASYVKRAADMAEEMKLHLVITIAGTEYVSTNILTYSPLTYLTNLYADYTGEKQSEANATEVLDVVTAMLGYGAAAETKDSGATTIAAKMTALEITAPTFTEGYTDHISGVVTEDDKTAINNIAQVGATLTGGMELTFTMKNTAYTALSIADFGTFTADENGKITVTGINAAMIKDALRLTFTGDGVDGVSANFTVGDFLESRRDNADETALAEATILYMMAARAYVLN